MRAAAGAPKTLEIHWFFERAARAAARRGGNPVMGTSKTFENQWKNSNSLVPVNPGPRGHPTGPVGSAAETLGTLAKPLEKQ